MNFNLATLRQRWHAATLTKRQTFWVAVGVVILTIYFGFAFGGWVTDGTAARQVRLGSEAAVIERLAPICVTQFNQDSQHEQKLANIKALSSSVQRANYVKGEGWATMPGEEAPDDKVASACADQLMSLDN